jgi:hypothetical protein
VIVSALPATYILLGVDVRKSEIVIPWWALVLALLVVGSTGLWIGLRA